MNKQQLRDQFFTEHTAGSTNATSVNIRRVSTAPHDLFEWFWGKLNRTPDAQASVARDADSSTSADNQITFAQLADKLKRVEACSNARKAEILRLRETADEMAEELERLQSWKAQALACTPDWQAIGKALNLKLGTSVSDQVLPAILNLLKERHELVITLRRLQAYCKGWVKCYQNTARYREVEDLLDKHHHSTETL